MIFDDLGGKDSYMSKNNITAQNIANEVGVSVTTVSRVLNGVAKKYRISNDTVVLVEKVAEKLNYTPNKIAKSLRLKKTNTVGLVVPDISNPWFAKIAYEIENTLRKRQYNVSLYNSNNDLAIEKNSLDLLEDWKVDGIIVAPIGIEYKHLLKTRENGMPMVLIDRYFDHVDLPFISTDDFQGAYQAINHFIELGHNKIACIQGLVGSSANTKRVEGYRKALTENGIPIVEDLIVGQDFGFKNGYYHAKHLLKIWEKGGLSAILSTGGKITLGILKAFKEENIKIPDDISIISFDEQDYCDLLYAPLTTVSHFDKKIGEKAVKLLFDQIELKHPIRHKRILDPTVLIKRESVKNLSV